MKSQTMFLIGGCSGSFAAPSENRPVYDSDAPRRMRRVPFRRDIFGSRTTCFLLRHKDTFIVVDQGLGVEPVSQFVISMLKAEEKEHATIHCLQTHFHDDHLEGLRSSALFFQKGLTLEFHCPNLSAVGGFCGSDSTYDPLGGPLACPKSPTMEDILAARFCAGYWPVTLEHLDKVGAKRHCPQFVPGASFALGEVKVRTLPLNHPGGCVGFRFEMPGVGAIVIATDYEPDPEPDPEVVKFFDGASLLLVDMQYRDAEYEGEIAIGDNAGDAMPRKGWGHGTPSLLLPMLKACSRLPQRVRIVHHDPKRPDTDLERFSDESAANVEDLLGGQVLDFQFAREGEIFWL
jgi:phosphoribosyl 1,2-cyclic phosphodiesterase